MSVGLSILLADETYGDPNHSTDMVKHLIELNMFIVRPSIKLSRSMIIESIKPPSPEVELKSTYCYLKTCYLCYKKLQPQDDIYMYKGDQGYCTEECRLRQMRIDTAEDEAEERRVYMNNLSIRRKFKMMSEQNSGRCNKTLLILRNLRQVMTLKMIWAVKPNDFILLN